MRARRLGTLLSLRASVGTDQASPSIAEKICTADCTDPLNPVGIAALSPGLRRSRYPGSLEKRAPSTLKGLQHKRALDATLSGLISCSWRRFPRVAATPQPWANRSNPVGIHAPHVLLGSARPAFTLIEILVAMVLTLMMMGMVVTIFALVTDSVAASRGTITMTDRLRTARSLLQSDLDGITVTPVPPRPVDAADGYLEIIEGPVGPVVPPQTSRNFAYEGGDLNSNPIPKSNDDPTALYNIDEDAEPEYDTTVGDNDDVLMFTTKSDAEPFIGRFTQFDNTGAMTVKTVTSQVAEVAYFLRGTTLYRRVLLVLPDYPDPNPDTPSVREDLPAAPGYYANYDISVHQEGGPFDPRAAGGPPRLVPNTLADLARREYRYGHQPWAYPHDARFWGRLGLPTLQECTFMSDLDNDANTQPVAMWPFPLQIPNPPWGSYQDQYFYPNRPPIIVPFGRRNPANNLPFVILTDIYLSGAYRDAVPPIVVALRNSRGELQYAPNGSFTEEFDAWNRANPWEDVHASGALASYVARAGFENSEGSVRFNEDVLLENVLSFDLKVWDPGAPLFSYPDASQADSVVTPNDPRYLPDCLLKDDGNPQTNGTRWPPIGFGAFVDLNYMCLVGDTNTDGVIDFPPTYVPANYALPIMPQFHHAGNPRSQLSGTPPLKQVVKSLWADESQRLPGPFVFNHGWSAVYDTGTDYYERDGLLIRDHKDNPTFLDPNGRPIVDQATNGFDDDRQGGVDDAGEREAPPPYDAPLEAIQIRIRLFDPPTRQIREVTVVHEFSPR